MSVFVFLPSIALVSDCKIPLSYLLGIGLSHHDIVSVHDCLSLRLSFCAKYHILIVLARLPLLYI